MNSCLTNDVYRGVNQKFKTPTPRVGETKEVQKMDFGSDRIEVLQAILIKLNKKENYAIVQRFWGNQTIESLLNEKRSNVPMKTWSTAKVISIFLSVCIELLHSSQKKKGRLSNSSIGKIICRRL